MLNEYDWYQPEPPPSPKVLVACENYQAATEMSVALATSTIVTWVGHMLRDTDFDVVLVAFEPRTDFAQTWYHTTLVPALKPGGRVVFLAT